MNVSTANYLPARNLSCALGLDWARGNQESWAQAQDEYEAKVTAYDIGESEDYPDDAPAPCGTATLNSERWDESPLRLWVHVAFDVDVAGLRSIQCRVESQQWMGVPGPLDALPYNPKNVLVEAVERTPGQWVTGGRFNGQPEVRASLTKLAEYLGVSAPLNLESDHKDQVARRDEPLPWDALNALAATERALALRGSAAHQWDGKAYHNWLEFALMRANAKMTWGDWLCAQTTPFGRAQVLYTFQRFGGYSPVKARLALLEELRVNDRVWHRVKEHLLPGQPLPENEKQWLKTLPWMNAGTNANVRSWEGDKPDHQRWLVRLNELLAISLGNPSSSNIRQLIEATQHDATTTVAHISSAALVGLMA